MTPETRRRIHAYLKKPALMNGLAFVAGALLTGAASAGVACLFVLAVVLFWQVAETGSAADWIASVSNAVMAITAVFAFIVARSWLPQLTTQEGYKLAIGLVNDHYLWLGPQNSLLRESGYPMAYIRHLQDGQTMTGSTVSYEDIMTSLDKTLLEHKARRDTIAQIRKRLATYGLYEARSVRARFSVLDKAYRDTCDAAATLKGILIDIKKILKLNPDYKAKSGYMADDITYELLEPHIIEAMQTYNKLSENYALMISTHDKLFSKNMFIGKMFSKNSSIGKLFKVKI